MSTQRRTKIEVYLSAEHKQMVLARASAYDLSASDFMKLKALDLLRETDEKIEGGLPEVNESGRVKVEVYLSEKTKKKIAVKAKQLGLALSDYMRLKALDVLNVSLTQWGAKNGVSKR
ncbi:hypothetical protein KY362_04530 [Candidatus Woesearchaeota archaeon]|nr:hypothetical protein [Candidatus Woesearchaeota archaeon]